MANPNRYYVNTSLPAALSAAVTSTATSLQVTQTTSFSTSVLPASVPFTLLLEWGTANAEVVTVTSPPTQSGGVVNFPAVTRGADGTAKVAHQINSLVAHGFSARDFAEPQAHMAASSGIHGIAGNVVGDSDIQTLTNKTLSSPTVASSGGVTGSVPIVQIDTSTNPNANIAGPHQITVAWTIPAFDAQAGTEYVVEVPFDGTFENQTLTFVLSIDGSTTGFAQATIGSAFLNSGTPFNGAIRMKMQCVTTGITGTVRCFSEGGIGITGTRSSGINANDAYLSGRDVGGSLDTTVAHNLRVNTVWGGSTAGQLITGYGSKFTRSGP